MTACSSLISFRTRAGNQVRSVLAVKRRLEYDLAVLPLAQPLKFDVAERLRDRVADRRQRLIERECPHVPPAECRAGTTDWSLLGVYRTGQMTSDRSKPRWALLVLDRWYRRLTPAERKRVRKRTSHERQTEACRLRTPRRARRPRDPRYWVCRARLWTPCQCQPQRRSVRGERPQRLTPPTPNPRSS